MRRWWLSGYVERGDLTEEQLDEALDVERIDDTVIIDDPAHVRTQYLTEDNLETRRSVWHPTADGRDPTTEALDAIVAERPLRVLEVGSGTGGFAARIAAALPGVRLTAIDQSPRFVELTRSRGVDAREGDAQDLPFGDEAFDVVAALWMLYHVPDVGGAIAEVTPRAAAGRAVRGGHQRRRAPGRPARARPAAARGDRLQQRRTARNSCARHFGDVRRTDLRPRAVFADSRVAEAYLALVGRGRRLEGAVVRRAARVRRRGDDLLLPLTRPGSVAGQRRLPGSAHPLPEGSAGTGVQGAVSTAFWVTGFETLPARSVAVARTKSVPFFRPAERHDPGTLGGRVDHGGLGPLPGLRLGRRLEPGLAGRPCRSTSPSRASRSPGRRRCPRRFRWCRWPVPASFFQAPTSSRTRLLGQRDLDDGQRRCRPDGHRLGGDLSGCCRPRP